MSTTDQPAIPPRRKRWVFPLVVLLAMMLAAGATWALAARFQSPAQVEAQAQPPEAGAITAPVRVGALRDSMTARVRFAPQGSESVPLHADPTAVVTGHPLTVGDTLTYGQSVISINGRPLFLVQGDFPLYRDLAVGDKGPDVQLWQDFLATTGYDIPRSERGTVGPATVRATARFYTARDYTSPAPGTVASPAPATTGDDAAAAPTTPATPAADTGSVIVPMAEVLVRPSAGQRIAELPAVGSYLGEEPSFAVTSGDLHATTAVPALDGVGLAEGMPVIVTAEDGSTLTGKLGPIPAPGKADDGGTIPDLQIPVALDVPIGEDWAGKDLLIEIIKQSVSDDAIVVPTRALAESGGGDAVFVKQADGTFQAIQVEVIGEAGGETAVRPLGEQAIAAGDLVRLS